MTDRERALIELKDFNCACDPEEAHWQADAVLCRLLVSLGYSDVVEAWKAVPKWYA